MNFGYPQSCDKCFDYVKNEFSSISIEGLRVQPFFREAGNFKLMLIGQDPTIRMDQERVKTVLMLDQENGQLRRWLKSFVGESKFNSMTIYATNVVKCSFSKMPSELRNGGRELLNYCFSNCSGYLKKEILGFEPNLILSFGEPAHEMVLKIIKENLPLKMKEAFSGQFHSISINNFSTNYSPCLHIKTFRVAETYGRKVENFKILINGIEIA
jgi:uracil-DNA glycosylase